MLIHVITIIQLQDELDIWDHSCFSFSVPNSEVKLGYLAIPLIMKNFIDLFLASEFRDNNRE